MEQLAASQETEFGLRQQVAEPTKLAQAFSGHISEFFKKCSHNFRWLVFVLALGLCGCADKTLLQDLSQDQAQTVVSALLGQGISAESVRDKGSKAAFRVVVDEGSYAEAVSILDRLNLPGESRTSVNEMVSSQGFFPSSRALESLRLERAQAAELEEALRVNPAIKAVRVIIKNLPLSRVSNQPGIISTEAETTLRTSVAVVIQKKPGVVLEQTAVTGIIRAAVPGVEETQIHLMVDEESPKSFDVRGIERSLEAVQIGIPLTRFLGMFRMPSDEHEKVSLLLAFSLMFASVMGFAAGFAFSFYRRRRTVQSRAFRKSEARLTGNDTTSAAIPRPSTKLLNNGR